LAVNAEAATIHLVPTVLAEIDNLKDQGRIPEVREKAAKLATRIKGLRDRGKLTQGVPVAGRITAIADPRDPSFEHLPAWLDSSTPDDRILASALVLQAAHPSAVVVLVAVDINIQNKAEACGLPYSEPIEPAPTGSP
jgi:predicted ribonuclease YlaK